MRLPDLCCYVRLAGGYPIVQLNMPYIEGPIMQSGFVLRDIKLHSLLQEVEQMFDKHTPILSGAKVPSKMPLSSPIESKVKGDPVGNTWKAYLTDATVAI